jgi:hypothetical protein
MAIIGRGGSACAAALSALVAASAAASPTAEVSVPIADAQDAPTAHVVSTFDPGTLTAGSAQGTLALTLGIVSLDWLRLEAGVDIAYLFSFGGASRALGFQVDGKLAVPEGVLFDGSPALAVGGYQFSSDPDQGAAILYAVATRSLGPLGRLSVGCFRGSPDLLTDPEGAPSAAGLLLAWDRALPELDDRLALGVDYQSGRSQVGALGVKLGFRVDPATTLSVGYLARAAADFAEGTLVAAVEIDLR